MIDLAAPLDGAAIVEDPYPFYAQLRRDAPVWRVPGTNAYFVSTWDLVTEAAGRVDDFSNHFRHTWFAHEDGSLGVLDTGVGGSPDVFAGADPPDHTEHRKVFFPELMQKKMEALEAPVAALTDELLDRMLVSERVDAAVGLANPLPMRVISEHVIGFRDADAAQIQRWVFTGSRFLSGRLRMDDMGALGAEAAGLLPWVTAQLDHALESPGERTVLSAAAEGVHNGVFSHDSAAFTLMILLGAGGETTVSLIGNAICVLAERPALQCELRGDVSRIPAFVEEILRFESPFRFHPRMATGDVTLGGIEIGERAMVALLWASANRDPAVFERPDDVWLDRANAPLQLGFGRGIHHCVGAPLARLEARIALTKLLERTRDIRLDPDDPPTWTDNLWLRRHDRVPIIVG